MSTTGKEKVVTVQFDKVQASSRLVHFSYLW